jgi:uncharacterized damage-inducible protein DinB
MSTIDRSTLEPLTGFPSREVASFLAQLDDQSRRLLKAIEDITPEELEWQLRPGMNTVGMLLAHNAIAEAWWTVIATGYELEKAQQALGISFDDDGMPLPEEGLPPAALVGKNRAFFEAILGSARTLAKERFRNLADADLDREIVRTRDDGTQRITPIRWILYHMLEHFAGHYGQILLLRHAYRAAQVPAKV